MRQQMLPLPFPVKSRCLCTRCRQCRETHLESEIIQFVRWSNLGRIHVHQLDPYNALLGFRLPPPLQFLSTCDPLHEKKPEALPDHPSCSLANRKLTLPRQTREGEEQTEGTHLRPDKFV